MKLTLGFAGDICVGGTALREASVLEICRDTSAFTELVDVSFANFESCVVAGEGGTTEYVAVTASDCRVLKESGVDVFTLANNHIRDFGDESLLATRRVLDEQDIGTVGAGRDAEEANAPLIVSKKGKTIAFLAATDATQHKASRRRPGIAKLNTNRLRRTIERLRHEVDLIIVGIHADLEFSNYPAPWKVRMSRQLARAGADIIVHHHPHTLQGYETYENSVIAYSLGNFVFPVHGMKYMDNREGGVDETVFLKVTVDFDAADGPSVAVEPIPAYISQRNSVVMATGSERDAILEKLGRYNAYLDDSSSLRERYWRRCKGLARSFVFGSYYTFRREGVRKMLGFVRFHFSTLVHRTWMRGLLSFGWL